MNSKNNRIKTKIVPKVNQNKKFESSKLNNSTINSLMNKKYSSKDSTDILPKELLNSVKHNQNLNENKSDENNKLRNTCRPSTRTHDNKKIYIKIQQIKDLSEYNNILNKSKTKKKKEKEKTTFKKTNKNKNKKRIKIKCISTMKNLSKKYNCKTVIYKNNKDDKKELKNKSESKKVNSEIIDGSFGDSSIEINKPKKSENFLFNNFPGRKSYFPSQSRNFLFEKLNINKKYEENFSNSGNEIKRKTLRHNITDYNYEKNNRVLERHNNFKISNDKDIIEEVKPRNLSPSYFNNKFSENDNELDNFCKKTSNNNINNSELFRFSNISSYNNNDLFYINNKNKIDNNNNLQSNKNSNYSIIINPKIDKIEGDENHIMNNFVIDDNFENEIIINDKTELKNINDDLASIPCINCGKMINLDEIDKHSNNCFKINEELKSEDSNNNFIVLIENKLNKIHEYLINIEKGKINITENFELNEYLDFMTMMKRYIEQILNIKIINSFAIEELSEINNILNKLMEKYFSSKNIFTLISRIKMLLEEKIKFFKDKNATKKDDIIKRKVLNIQNKNDKTLRNTLNLRLNEQHKIPCEDNSIDQAISESETMEFFDLKKMEKILDKKKELKEYNLDNYVNEVKNKRLFLMEVLKVKYQKINNNKTENQIPPLMIWKEAMKKKVKMNNWTKFIFDELNNPNKYLKMLEKRKEKKNK